ncbi:MAG: Chromate resistance protein ChrB [Desulfobacterales bacterium]
MCSIPWLLFIYKVPTEPSRARVGLWRRLKAMGAVYLQSGVCLLPDTLDHARRLKMLERAVAETGGEAVILRADALDRSQREKVAARFQAEREEHYREFISRCDDFEAEIDRETKARHFSYAEIEENEADLKKLKHWLAAIRKLDFYGAPLAKEAERRIQRCEALLDAYARRVFEEQDGAIEP